MSETICVIGVSGFVGSHVAAELLSRGISVNGTLRAPRAPANRWLIDRVAPIAENNATLTLRAADLNDPVSLKDAMAGCSGVVMCAGIEEQAPSTIDLMVGAAHHVLDAATELGIARAVFTSSTGSTNPPQGEPTIKNEVDHWSDPDAQIAAGKFSPAAKTLMDRTALARMSESGDALRVSVINPSMIAGPAFQPEPVASLRAFHAIIEGRRMGDAIPNGSMSMIDVRDLAKLHVNALVSPTASGRYFGVKASWHWREILASLQRALPGYAPPLWPTQLEPVRPTQFDLTRQATLGVALRDLDAITAGVIDELRARDLI